MPGPPHPPIPTREQLEQWRRDAARVEQLWNQIGRGGEEAGEIVEILDSTAEKQGELAEEEEKLAGHQSGSETLSKEERTRVAAQVEHLRDTLDGYEVELGEFADAVRDPVQRAYEYAGCLMEQLVGLHHNCDVHDLKRTASEIATELCRLDQHIKGVRSELGTNIHPATVTGDSYREGHPHPAPSEPHRQCIIRPEGRQARQAAYLARRHIRSGLAQVQYPENALAKSHIRFGYRQMRRYFGVAH